MKKLWLLLPLIVLLFSFKSAAYTGPTGTTYQYEYVFTEGTNTLRFYSNYLFFGCSQNNSSRPELCAYIPASSSVAEDIDKYYVTTVVTGRNTYYMYTPDKKYPSVVLNQDTQWVTWAELKYNNSMSTSNWPVTWTPQIYQAAGVPVFNTFAAGAEWAYSEMQPDIDWEHPYYSANITSPKMNINYRELSSVPIVDVPLNITKNANDTIQNVYLEMYATFYMPTEIYADYDPRNGKYTFTGYPTNSVTWGGAVIPAEDMKTWSTASADYIHLALVDIWEDCYNMVDPNDITWHFNEIIPEGAYNSIKQKYLDMRKVNCFYGSNCIINARYFTIVNDTQYVVGSWTNWKSYNPYTFTETLPDYYIPLVQASGTENNTYDVQVPTEIEPGTGNPTGVYTDPNINITVTQNVPNYPDYPTIVSYNKDNLLVDTMNWADNLQGFFGEFGSFLEVSFAFIPGWIWAIIGFGFSLSIVVMFLKIL